MDVKKEAALAVLGFLSMSHSLDLLAGTLLIKQKYFAPLAFIQQRNIAHDIGG